MIFFLALMLAMANRVSADPLESMIKTRAVAGTLQFEQALGFNTHHKDATGLAQMKAAGFSWVRCYVLWKSCEKSKGVYDYSVWDGMQAAIKANGLKPLLLLCYWNPLYNSNGADNNRSVMNTPEEQTAFVNWVKALVGHFKERGITGQYWEVWNEPDAVVLLKTVTYATLVDQTAAAIHSVDPTAHVISGGLATYDTDMLEGALAAGMANHLTSNDGIGIHTYNYMGENAAGERAWPGPIAADPERMFNGNDRYSPRMPNCDAIKAKHGVSNIPTYNTEASYSLGDFRDGPYDHPQIILRWALTTWAVGFPMNILYDLDDVGYGILNKDHENAFKAIATLSNIAKGRTLTGYTIYGSVYANSNLNLLRMEGARDVVYALWVRSGTQKLSVPSGTTGSDMLGNAITIETSVTVDVTAGPIYLTFIKD